MAAAATVSRGTDRLARIPLNQIGEASA